MDPRTLPVSIDPSRHREQMRQAHVQSQLAEAMVSSSVIDQAVGILMRPAPACWRLTAVVTATGAPSDEAGRAMADAQTRLRTPSEPAGRGCSGLAVGVRPWDDRPPAGGHSQAGSAMARIAGSLRHGCSPLGLRHAEDLQ